MMTRWRFSHYCIVNTYILGGKTAELAATVPAKVQGTGGANAIFYLPAQIIDSCNYMKRLIFKFSQFGGTNPEINKILEYAIKT